MSKLKTLRDLDNLIWVNGEAQDVIRNEAIRDIKEIKEKWLDHGEANIGNLILPYSKSLIDYIKWKFNIKEEDLK